VFCLYAPTGPVLMADTRSLITALTVCMGGNTPSSARLIINQRLMITGRDGGSNQQKARSTPKGSLGVLCVCWNVLVLTKEGLACGGLLLVRLGSNVQGMTATWVGALD
jgi:hypothetical protein